MLNLDKYKFSIQFYDEEDEFVGKVVHPDLGIKSIFIRSIDMNHFEKYDIYYMRIECPTKTTGDSALEILTKNAPEEIKENLDKFGEVIKKFYSTTYIINVDKKTCQKLKNKDKYAIAFFYHELGHFMHSDETYPDEDRESLIYEKKVSQAELDADDFAFDVYGETFYDAMRMIQDKFLKASEKEDDPVYLLDAMELKFRIEHIIERIKTTPPHQ